MRLDFPISNHGMERYRETELPNRMPDDGRTLQVRSRSGGSTLQNAGEIGQETVRAPEPASQPFSEIVADTSNPAPLQISASTGRASRASTAGQAIGDGSTILESVSDGDLNNSVPDTSAAGTVVLQTPFGAFDAFSARPVLDVIAQSAWEVYFVTHAPAEWKNDAASRAQFASLYGSEALLDVDCHGTVPRNIDPVWVTRIDADTAGGRG
jgi:hypothetical protein